MVTKVSYATFQMNIFSFGKAYCTTHCLHLILEDIRKLDRVKKVVDHTKCTTKYIIYLQPYTCIEPFEKKQGSRELVRSAK